MKRILFIPDTHAPFTDMKAWRLMMRVARSFKPDIVAVMGDLMDFHCLSRHPRKHTGRGALMAELGPAIQLKREIDGLDPSRKIFLIGNHERRLINYVRTRAPELEGIPGLTVESLLELDRSWEVPEDRSYATIGKVYLTHSVNERSGIGALRQAQKDFESSVIMAHTHRMESFYLSNLLNGHHVARSFGWLGSPQAHKDYMHKAAAGNWCLGFGLGYLAGSGTVYTQEVPIIRGTAMVEGRLFR